MKEKLRSLQVQLREVVLTSSFWGTFRHANLNPGEWFLVQGGGALQIGKLLGATIIATGRGQAGCDRVKQLGADYAIDRLPV